SGSWGVFAAFMRGYAWTPRRDCTARDFALDCLGPDQLCAVRRKRCSHVRPVFVLALEPHLAQIRPLLVASPLRQRSRRSGAHKPSTAPPSPRCLEPPAVLPRRSRKPLCPQTSAFSCRVPRPPPPASAQRPRCVAS